MATYEAARESLERLKSFGINFVYTHNYGCEPGSHLSFAEVLRAADDVGMLVSFSQPHFSHYDWKAPDADRRQRLRRGMPSSTSRTAGNHPSVVFYSMSHNATGYDEDMNPDMIDGRARPARHLVAEQLQAGPARRGHRPADSTPAASSITTRRATWARCTTATSIPTSPRSRSCPTGSSTGRPRASSRCSPASTERPSPGTGPCTAAGTRASGTFGNARVPWEFCLAEWNAQFLGDRAYQISEMEKTNLRWEARQFRAGKRLASLGLSVSSSDRRRFDGSACGDRDVSDRQLARLPHLGRLGDLARGNTGTSGGCAMASISRRKELPVDWDNLQRPGFSPDYVDQRYERMDLAFERSDWVATADGQALFATTGRCWPTSAASPAGSPARTTTSSRARPSRSSSSSSTTPARP